MRKRGYLKQVSVIVNTLRLLQRILIFFAFCLAHTTGGVCFADERTKLEIFADNGFQPGIPGLRVEGGVSKDNIVKRFGLPLNTISKKVMNSREPGLEELIITWEYPGMVIKTSTPLIGKKSNTWIVEIILTSSNYVLKYCLGIGKPRSEFLTVLGKPDKETTSSIKYSAENFATVGDVEFHGLISISIEFDESDKAKKIVWGYGAD